MLVLPGSEDETAINDTLLIAAAETINEFAVIAIERQNPIPAARAKPGIPQ
jgi:hypothetical protein